jgi:hypothetical protein
MDNMGAAFEKGKKDESEGTTPQVVAELYAKIGKLQVERDFLSKVLKR